MFVSRFCTAVIMSITLAPVMAYSGDLDSPAAPTGTSSAMYTLTDIYNRLDTGTATAKRTGAFTEPTDGPGTATGRTLDEIIAKAPAKDDTDGASASQVLSGKTFWGLTTAGWGTQTGSIVTRTLSDGTTTVSAGYYEATTLNAEDTDLWRVQVCNLNHTFYTGNLGMKCIWRYLPNKLLGSDYKSEPAKARPTYVCRTAEY